MEEEKNQSDFLLFAVHSCSLECGLAVLDFVPEAVLAVFLHTSFHTMKHKVWMSVSLTMCSAAAGFCVHGMIGKRSGVPRGAAPSGIWHFWAPPAQCWWRRVDKPSSCSGWTVFGQGARVLCPVPVTHSSYDPNSSSSPATARHLKQRCCRELDCAASFVFPPWFHGRFLCTKNKQEGRPEEWLVWKHKFCPVVPQTELPSAPLKQNPDLCWRPVFMFPYVWLGCVKAGDPFIPFRNQMQTVKRNNTSYSFLWPLF